MILFDGVCNLCNGFVQFVIARDPHARFAFASLQSRAGASLLRERGLSSRPGVPESVLLVDGDRVYSQSTAALRVLRRLSFPWSLAYVFIGVPVPIRDRVYAWIARNRYRWFGTRDVCIVPTPALRSRFLAD